MMGSDVASRFGRNLARARRRAGVSQEELCSLSSIHRTEVSQLERGLRVPRIDTLVKLRDGLGVETDELLAGIRWRVGDYRPGGFIAEEGERR